jgi:hypothetical protein
MRVKLKARDQLTYTISEEALLDNIKKTDSLKLIHNDEDFIVKDQDNTSFNVTFAEEFGLFKRFHKNDILCTISTGDIEVMHRGRQQKIKVTTVKGLPVFFISSDSPEMYSKHNQLNVFKSKYTDRIILNHPESVESFIDSILKETHRMNLRDIFSKYYMFNYFYIIYKLLVRELKFENRYDMYSKIMFHIHKKNAINVTRIIQSSNLNDLEKSFMLEQMKDSKLSETILGIFQSFLSFSGIVQDKYQRNKLLDKFMSHFDLDNISFTFKYNDEWRDK